MKSLDDLHIKRKIDTEEGHRDEEGGDWHLQLRTAWKGRRDIDP